MSHSSLLKCFFCEKTGNNCKGKGISCIKKDVLINKLNMYFTQKQFVSGNYSCEECISKAFYYDRKKSKKSKLPVNKNENNNIELASLDENNNESKENIFNTIILIFIYN